MNMQAASQLQARDAAVADIRARLSAERAEIEEQRAALETRSQDLGAVERWIDNNYPEGAPACSMEDVGDIELVDGQGEHEPPGPVELRAEGQESDLTPHVEPDLTGTKSHQERLVRMAEANGGAVNATQAASLIVELGYSSAKKRNLVSVLYRMMKDSGEWVRKEPGTFQYLGPSPS